MLSKANKPSFSPAEHPVEEGDKGKEGNEGAGNVANQKDRLATGLVIVTQGDDGDTWLAPLEAASRMFASSLFCKWKQILNQSFSRVSKKLFVASLLFLTWVGRFSALVRDFLVSG